jgi:hypothetical protein
MPGASSVMNVGAKRAKAKEGATLDPTCWRAVTRCPAHDKLTLLEVMGEKWTFQDPENDRLYRCEVDASGNEVWFFKLIRTESEWISQSDAARLIGVSRQAIRNAIVWKRLGTVACNGRPMVSRAEVLALPIDPRRRRVRKS